MCLQTAVYRCKPQFVRCLQLFDQYRILMRYRCQSSGILSLDIFYGASQFANVFRYGAVFALFLHVTDDVPACDDQQCDDWRGHSEPLCAME
ncbi:hypothetical protein D1006_39165 [Burkholderia stabilis]|uniref:Uncharacterized protein n=1 Tax=Burkholderia stabilis TaxID=95485 RepID=A0A4Q2A5H8_9BURK|nr:hypothetical protein D1006_39165 [Burkholderia stabilis]